MIQGPVLLDSDTLSEIIKGRNASVQYHAREYLIVYGRFQLSIITRYEILRGLKAKDAPRQIARFDQQCRGYSVLPLTDEVVEQAADIYGFLWKRGTLIEDADILIAATAQVHGLLLVTGNLDHFTRIPDLRVATWHSGPVMDPT